MAAVTVPNSGKWDVEVDVGYTIDAFRLDANPQGLLDSTTYVLDGTTTYASVTDGVLSLSINRGRKNENDQFPSGTCAFVLNDTKADGAFGPFDSAPANPYWDQVDDVPGLAPGRAVRITRYDNANVAQKMFVGYVVNFDYTFALGGLDTVTVFCADATYRLAQTFLNAYHPTKEFTGARVASVLDRPEVNYPTGAARDISAGTVELGGSSSYAIAEGTNVKTYFDAITYTAERGRIFVDREGVLVSQDRVGATFSNPVIRFSDQGTNVPYRAVGITFQAEDIINRVAVTPAGGTRQVANDAASQSLYFVKTLNIDGSLLHDNTAAATLASYLLAGTPEPRFDQVETFYGALTAAQRDTCALVDVGDTVEITKTVIVGGSNVAQTQELSVEGLEHRVTFGGGQTSRYYTAPTTILLALVLDSSSYGILDTNALT